MWVGYIFAYKAFEICGEILRILKQMMDPCHSVIKIWDQDATSSNRYSWGPLRNTILYYKRFYRMMLMMRCQIKCFIIIFHIPAETVKHWKILRFMCVYPIPNSISQFKFFKNLCANFSNIRHIVLNCTWPRNTRFNCSWHCQFYIDN